MASPVDVSRWLAQGGRIRLQRAMTTNGGVAFSVGEELRLVSMIPYENSNLYHTVFASMSDPGKTIYLSMGGLSPDDVEYLEC